MIKLSPELKEGLARYLARYYIRNHGSATVLDSYYTVYDDVVVRVEFDDGYDVILMGGFPRGPDVWLRLPERHARF